MICELLDGKYREGSGPRGWDVPHSPSFLRSSSALKSTPNLEGSLRIIETWKMGREEQQEEREVLDSIFPDEITGMP